MYTTCVRSRITLSVLSVRKINYTYCVKSLLSIILSGFSYLEYAKRIFRVKQPNLHHSLRIDDIFEKRDLYNGGIKEFTNRLEVLIDINGHQFKMCWFLETMQRTMLGMEKYPPISTNF